MLAYLIPIFRFSFFSETRWFPQRKMFPVLFYSVAAVPSLFGTRDGFRGRQFFHGLRVGEGFRIIQAYYIYCVLYFCYGYVSSTSDHQALGPGVWGPPCSNQEDQRWLSLEFRRGFFPWLQNVKLSGPSRSRPCLSATGEAGWAEALSVPIGGDGRLRAAGSSCGAPPCSLSHPYEPPALLQEGWGVKFEPQESGHPCKVLGTAVQRGPVSSEGSEGPWKGWKVGREGKVGRSSFGPWALCLWRGKGHHVFHSFAPRSPQWLDISFEWEVANSAFKKPYAAILFALGSCPGRPPQQDRVNSLVRVCVCVCGHTQVCAWTHLWEQAPSRWRKW